MNTRRGWPGLIRTGLPALGVGLGYRRELHDSIVAHQDSIDCLEVISDHYLNLPTEHMTPLLSLAGQLPVVPHGIDLSIGTSGELDGDYLDRLARLVGAIGAPWCSDHLSFTRTANLEIGSLTPLLRTRVAAAEVAAKTAQVRHHVGVPFLLENISYYLDLPGELSEAQFITEVMEQSECFLLLDFTNLFTNSVNHGFEPEQFLADIPLERVVEVHLAGGAWSGDTLLDTHSAPVPGEVWALFTETVSRMPALRCVILERDQDFPSDFSELTADLNRARGILERTFAA